MPGRAVSRARRIERHGIRAAGVFLQDRREYLNAVTAGRGVTEQKPKKKKMTKAETEAADEIQKLYAELQETWPVVAFEEVL